MLKRIRQLLAAIAPASAPPPSATTPAAVHCPLPLERISGSARRVIQELQRAGYAAYLVGGGVRDLLLDAAPKDFDVATDATPEQVKKLFRSALIIGRRFRIVHVRFGREIIEVTTFRGVHTTTNSREAVRSASGLLLRDNVYGDLESDALRRDFTVNALYFDPTESQVLDFAGGLADLKARRLRVIGDPATRYREDPVRMLRAIRFAAKLGFELEPATAAPIKPSASLLGEVPPARLFEEVLKLFMHGAAAATFAGLQQHGLLAQLFPGLAEALATGDPVATKLVAQCLANTDTRIQQDQRVTPAFLYAAFLWPPLRRAEASLATQDSLPASQIQLQAAQGVIGQQLSATSIPKRFLIPLREIWQLQERLSRRDGGRAFELLEHPRFRAAYDFLLLREHAGEATNGLGAWWTEFQSASGAEREAMVAALGRGPRQRRKRQRRRKPGAAGNNGQTPGGDSGPPQDDAP